ncbi:MAG: hypothetical protein U5J63_00570 [Fodinibius sp.]|nr:hypothetical protein [Fodinibius sp.]
MGPNDISDHLSGIIHQDTQQHDNHFDLTVSEIYGYTEAGSLDFGGSEFQPAEQRLIESQKKNEDDDYGWWHLRSGSYQAKINEKVADLNGSVALLSLHSHARQSGILGNTSLISAAGNDPLTINFQVPKAGCNIKENARFAVLYIMDQS